MNLTLSEISKFYERTHQYEYKELIFFKDLFLVPIVLSILLFLLRKWQRKLPSDLKPYYIKAFLFKLIAIPLFLFHHTFIYKGGVDQFTYYWASNELIQLFYIQPSLAFHILFSSIDTFNISNLNFEISHFIFAPNESATIKFTAIIGLFTGNSFLVTSIICSFLSFLGSWKILEVFNKYYPGHAKILSITCVFIPSVIFWTSVISKEVYCFWAMGYLFYYLIDVFEYKKYKIYNFFIILITCYILIQVKVYILISLILAFVFFILFGVLKKIQNPLLRNIGFPIVLVVFIGGLAFVMISLEGALKQFALSNMLETIKTNYDYLTQEGFASSRYTLGEIEPTLASISKLGPAGINVTLFRHYLWEANKPITLIAALESFLTLLLTLYVIYKSRLKLFKFIFTDKMLLSIIIFALVFSLAVGLTSGNFGTLMRYKIPMMPFYYSALAIIYFKSTERKPKIEPSIDQK